MRRNYFIAVSGVMGSGKTTLAKKIASGLNFEYVSTEAFSKQYLPDLFASTSRWAFEAQVSFLAEKSALFLKKIARNNIVLDRAFSEDSDIFARYFYEKKFMDKRSYETYLMLYQNYMRFVGPPDFLIYCECDLLVIKERIEKKVRSFQANYPQNHIEDVYEMYLNWYKNYNNTALYKVDMANVNIMDKRNERILISDIEKVINDSTNQLDLFLIRKEGDSDKKYSILQEIIPYDSLNIKKVDIKRKSSGIIKPYPYAYIAAPFTSIADIQNGDEHNLFLFDDIGGHGEIPPDNQVRMMLEMLDISVRKQGVNTLIPHKDINEWGRKKLTPKDVYKNCILSVENCDVFIGLFGFSPGVHMEYGYAIAKGKPCILINCNQVESSYISRGISGDQNRVLVLNVNNLLDVPECLSGIDIKKFIDIPL